MAMLFLYEIWPDYYENWSLALPENERSNTIPDILDEALWCTELFRRTQLTNGEVIEGIESIEHPKRGESSWRDSHPTAIKPGTPAVAYKWAGVAARMSRALMSYDTVLSESYKTSALRAIAWAQENLDHPYYQDFLPGAVDLMSAGVYLYLLTRDAVWHDLFVEGWERSVTSNDRSLNRYDPYPLLSYALLPTKDANPEIQGDVKNKIQTYAESMLKGLNENSALLLRPSGERVNFSIVEQLGSEYLIGAHLISGEDRYLDGLLKCSHYSMGVNPLNLCYTTGMGHRFIEPFYLDYEYTGLPIPVGIPAYGPVRLDNPLPLDNVWGWHQRRAQRFASVLKPEDVRHWPLVELYFRYVGYAAMNEFTIQQGMREQLTRWAYLAQCYQNR
jgi:endoglucanase